MEEVLILNKGATIKNNNENKIWTITDVYFNLSTRDVEFMAKREGDDFTAIYIPQSKMEEWLDKEILKPVKEGEELELNVLRENNKEEPELEKE